MVTVTSLSAPSNDIVDVEKLSTGLEVLRAKRLARLRRRCIMDEILTSDEAFSSLLILMSNATKEIEREYKGDIYVDYVIDPTQIHGHVSMDGKQVDMDDIVSITKKVVRLIFDGIVRKTSHWDGTEDIEAQALAYAQVGIGTTVLTPPKVTKTTISKLLDTLC